MKRFNQKCVAALISMLWLTCAATSNDLLSKRFRSRKKRSLRPKTKIATLQKRNSNAGNQAVASERGESSGKPQSRA